MNHYINRPELSNLFDNQSEWYKNGNDEDHDEDHNEDHDEDHNEDHGEDHNEHEDIDNQSNRVKTRAAQELFIWEPLSKEWRSKLLSDNFVTKNCLGDGDCQFRSIETALTNAGCKTTPERLRQAVCKYINRLDNNHFFDIIQSYRLEKQNGEFVGDWDPFAIKSKRDFTKHLRTPGFGFMGDNITLSLICKAMKLDIVLLDDGLNVIDLSNNDEQHQRLIVLFYDRNKQHYKTIGIQTSKRSIKTGPKVQTMFRRTDLPPEIDRLIDKHTFYIHHIKDICAQELKCGRIQLNKILRTIQERTLKPIGQSDKKQILKIIRNILENENYFNTTKTS